MKNVTVKKSTQIVLLIAAIVTGILFCCLGISLFQVLFTIIGALLALGGIYAIISKNLIPGIIITGLGVLIIVAAWKWSNVAFIIFGVMMVISGILGFIGSVMREDARSCISSVVSAVLGGFLIGFREGADWMIFVIGSLFILLGVVGIILLLLPSKKAVKTVDVKDIKPEDVKDK